MRSRILFLVAAAAACAPAAPAPDSAAPAMTASADTSLVGTVRIVGSAPMNVQVMVEPGAGRSVRVEGPLMAELQRLAGAEVAVRGQPRGNALEVTAYEVRAVDGVPVAMGVVERAPNGTLQLRKPDGQIAYLTGATDDLQVGQKVWVQGPSAVVVQSYGILTP